MSDKSARRGGLLHIFMSRPVLLSAIGAGVAAGLALALVPNPLGGVTRAILAWDVGCLSFVAGGLLEMKGAGTGDIAARAARQDEGRHLILWLVLIAALASLLGAAFELSLAKHANGVAKTLRVSAAFGTVAVSWFMVQLIFALHYAHQFYSAGAGGKPTGGLNFPGEDKPDYWDFLHFALIIGVANQTADIAFTSRTMRRTGTLHGVLSFVFNTLVLALTVNLAASLF